MNQLYFQLLKHKYDNQKTYTNTLTPTALLNQEESSKLPIFHWSNVADRNRRQTDYHLILRPLHAGIGSNLKRERYVAPNSLSAKGIDLKVSNTFFSFPQLPSDYDLSLASVQILRSIQALNDGLFESISFDEGAGPLTLSSILNEWENLSKIMPFPNQLHHHKNLFMQEQIPTLNAPYKAPGGHGLFALETLQKLASQNFDEKTFIILSNGEDIGSFPDTQMLDWMQEKRIPMAMIVTDRTTEDWKGGLLSVHSKNHQQFGIYELASAQHDNKVEWFKQLNGLFNTNMFIINANVLSKMIQTMLQGHQMSFEDWIHHIPFDLIQNQKRDSKYEYIQLESAMASVFMGLDTYFKTKENNQSILHFIRVPEEGRFEFFNPIKTGLDFYHLFFSGDFEWNKQKLKLEKVKNNFNMSVAAQELEKLGIQDLYDILQLWH